MKFRAFFNWFIFFCITNNCFAQSNSTFTLLNSTVTKEHLVKFIVNNHPNDTLVSTIVVKYNAKAPSQLLVNESFSKGKITFKNDNSFKLNEIIYYEFYDDKQKLRRFKYLSDIRRNNLTEIITTGKINYYLVFSDKDIIEATHGRIFLEKDGVWLIQKKWVDKKFINKIKTLLNDEPDLAEKLNVQEISQEDLTKILYEYNSRN